MTKSSENTSGGQLAETLELIDLGISTRMDRAAQAVVKNKTLIDAAVAEYDAKMLAGDLHDGGYGPAEPLPFVHRILPFAYTLGRTNRSVMARVPTANTLGCSWHWRRGSLDVAEIEKCRAKVDNEAALLSGTIDPVSYVWIKALGLIAPLEGKNRVDFFRGERIKSIPAKVTEWTYIEPHRIVLYSVIDKAFKGTWAVLDGRWVEFVPHPSWTIPLMAAYGVPIENSWPKTYPAPADVLHALFDDSRLNSPFGNPEHDNATVIDLDTIKAIDEFQAEPQRTTMTDLKGVKIDHRVWQLSIVGVLSALVLMILLPAQWVEARIACGILMGAAGCAGMLPYLMHIITVPRSGLAKEQYLPTERCPKNAGRQGNRKLG